MSLFKDILKAAGKAAKKAAPLVVPIVVAAASAKLEKVGGKLVEKAAKKL